MFPSHFDLWDIFFDIFCSFRSRVSISSRSNAEMKRLGSHYVEKLAKIKAFSLYMPTRLTVFGYYEDLAKFGGSQEMSHKNCKSPTRVRTCVCPIKESTDHPTSCNYTIIYEYVLYNSIRITVCRMVAKVTMHKDF